MWLKSAPVFMQEPHMQDIWHVFARVQSKLYGCDMMGLARIQPDIAKV